MNLAILLSALTIVGVLVLVGRKMIIPPEEVIQSVTPKKKATKPKTRPKP